MEQTVEPQLGRIRPEVTKEPGLPPILPGLPLLGNLIEFCWDRTALVRRGYASLGPVFGIRLINKSAAVLVGPEHHQIVFEQTDKTLSMDRPYAFIAAAFGRIGFLAPPDVYNEQRPIIHLPFKASKTASHLRVMHLEIEAFLATLPSSGELDLNAAVLEIVRNVAAHALMGKAFRDASGGFWTHYQKLSDALDPIVPPSWPIPKFVRRDAARTKLRAMVKPMIDERRARPGEHDDFLNEFVNGKLKGGGTLSDDDILSLVTAMVFAGHETTAGQATWTLIQLAQHPEYSDLVRREADELFPRDTTIDATGLARLQHAAMAVAETSRMRPSVSMMFREASQDLDVGGFLIPKGWLVLISPPVAQSLPELFPDPDRYDPLRFSPERDKERHQPHAIISFGGGIHKCAGVKFALWEMTMIASLFARELEWELLGDPPRVEDKLGPARPTRTRVRFRRRAPRPRSVVVEEGVKGCPFHASE